MEIENKSTPWLICISFWFMGEDSGFYKIIQHFNKQVKQQEVEIQQHKLRNIFYIVVLIFMRAKCHSNSQLVDHLRKEGIIKTDIVYYTLLSIDRKHFIPQPPYYNDGSSPIGFGVVISAPHMHAYALEYMQKYLSTAKYVLDVGSGTGILTLAMALMTPKSAKVFGIQHVPELVEQSIQNIKKENEEIFCKLTIIGGDGRKGWPDKSIKFDVIHVGAAPEKVPKQLTDQLADGGIMIIPIGKQSASQKYMKIQRVGDKLIETQLLYVCYVPLTDLSHQKSR